MVFFGFEGCWIARIVGPLRDRVDWVDGWLTGPLWIGADATLKIYGSIGKYCIPSPYVLNEGAVQLFRRPGDDTTGFGLDTGMVWTNAPGATMEILTDFPVTCHPIGQKLYNYGTMTTSNCLLGVNLENHGNLEVQGSVVVTNTYEQTASGVTVFNVGEDGNSSLSAGHVSLRGGLVLNHLPGLNPPAGMQFQLLNFNDSLGEFSSYFGLRIREGLKFKPQWSSHALALQAVGVTNCVSRIHNQNGISLCFDGDAEECIQVEASEDLENWVPICVTNTMTGTFVIEPDTGNSLKRFYRAVPSR